MNRCTIRSLITAILFLLPCAASALPGPHDPASGGRNYTCLSCHTGLQAAAGLGAASWNNLCITCHNGSTPDPAVPSAMIKPFTVNDYANPYVTETRPGKVYQTSHKWLGSDSIPQAGALPPVDASPKGMNKRGLTGSVTCARCHNVHGDSVASSAVPPYLRSTNDSDQMCMDCHRVRDKKSQLFGTHPVNVSYTSAKTKANPTQYFASPLTNPSNTSAQVKLVNGKLVCTTCHGVHFTDSNSRTFDNHSAAFGGLSTSTGTLLRVDPRGGNVDGTNICTTCHSKLNHSSAMNVQCVDCHSGHVEYITPADVAAGEGTPNTYLLRRYINYSSGVKLSSYRRKMFYTYTSPNSAKWRLANGKGVCEGCHTPPATVPEHAGATNRTTCTTAACHGTGHIGKDPVPGCGTTVCHGTPPQNTSAGYPVGYGYYGTQNYATSGVYKNESTAGHPTHAAGKPYSFKCDECHKGNKVIAGDHNGTTNNAAAFQWVFVDKTLTITGAASTFTPGPVTSTCANMYCHSYGLATLTKPKTVNWAAGVRGSIVNSVNRCVACHNGVVGAFNNHSTRSHFRHVSNSGTTGKNYGCVMCHAGTVTSNTAIAAPANHVNGVRDLAIDATAIAGKVAGSTLSGTTCTTYCHTDGNGTAPLTVPLWTDRNSGKCDTCHKTATSTPQLASNAHFEHFSSASATYGPRLAGVGNNSCTICHTTFTELGATHVDGTINVNAAGTCTTQCHRNAAPTWTSPARLACETCHDGSISYDSRAGFNNISAPRKVMTTYNTVGHGNYNGYSCTNCHDNTSKHINKLRGDNTRLGVYEGAVQNNLCSSCHNNTGIVTNENRRITVSHVTLLCSACHDVHGTSNYASVIANIKYKVISSAVIITKPDPGYGFINTITRRGLCQVCHTSTNHFRRGVAELLANGFDGIGTQNHTGFDNNTNCLSCHPHINGTSAFYQSGGACDSCHGYPPVPTMGSMGHLNNYSTARLQNYSGGGGVHAVPGHLLPTIKATAGLNGCTNCHYNVTHTMTTSVWAPGNSTTTKKAPVNVVVNPVYKFNASKSLDASRYVKATPGNSGACSNVSCHFQPTPRWSTEK